MASDAVNIDRVSRIVGYKILKGNFQTVSPNLPQRIAIFAEANTANQSNLTGDNLNLQITSAQQAGNIYGYGSPVYNIARILLPLQGGGVNGVPVIVYPQAVAGGSSAKVIEVTPSGVATANGTHTIVIAGRQGIDGSFYDINIVAGDTSASITAKIYDAVNNVLGCPMLVDDSDYSVIFTSKWKGLTSNDLIISVENNGNDLGITYDVETVATGSGTPSVSDGLALFGNDWVTIVVNSYGLVSSVMSTLESFNGIPSPTSPTGRYASTVMKPFIALSGSVSDDDSATTDLRLNNVTIAVCPAPASTGLPMEAAANMAVLFANITSSTPHLDVAGKPYSDMPTPTSIGTMASYESRDLIVKKGCSTVDLVGGQYVVQDFVTTYHPVGETPPQFRYCRNIMVDLNVRFGYYLLEQINVVDHVIANDTDIVSVGNIVKPKQWKALVAGYANDLSKRALIVDPSFMEESITVELSTSNPDRLETEFSYKRSGVARILSTTATAGFNFGTL